jgi:hypothetical protein
MDSSPWNEHGIHLGLGKISDKIPFHVDSMDQSIWNPYAPVHMDSMEQSMDSMHQSIWIPWNSPWIP